MAITLTNHLSSENMGITREPIIIDSADTSTPKLPDDCVIVPPVQLSNVDLPRSEEGGAVRPSHDRLLGSKGSCATILLRGQDRWIKIDENRSFNQG